jgi:uncharacterized protein YqcC (DUF446 family)
MRFIKNLFRRKVPEKNKKMVYLLDDIEAEMKRIGYWDYNPPKIKVTNFMDAPSFELWLQCIFIPNARKAVKEGKYPNNSQVGVIAMRQYDYHSYMEEAQDLCKLLSKFDDAVVNS